MPAWIILFIGLFICSASVQAQTAYAREIINKLTSDNFHGRGYYKKGDRRAAKFIMNEFRKAGVMPLKENYFQEFEFPVNTFPGKMKVAIDGKVLVAGSDYIVSPASPSLKGTFPLVRIKAPVNEYYKNIYSGSVIIVDKTAETDTVFINQVDSLLKNPPDVKAIIIIEPTKLTWSVAGKVNKQVILRMLKNNFPSEANTIQIAIENKFYPQYRSVNVMGILPGTSKADSFLVFTAHYDHLGRMGKKAIFPGANDNASGTAMILDLARYYSMPANRPAKSLLFIAFAAEEAGLIGSEYFTGNPVIPLERMSFLLNLDLMGNGDDGMMVVNGELHQEEFNLLERINKEYDLLKTIGKRGKARNSDHYWFSEKGVPSFFFYTMGGSKAYHDIYDTASQLPLSEYDDVKKLIQKFVQVKGN